MLLRSSSGVSTLLATACLTLLAAACAPAAVRTLDDVAPRGTSTGVGATDLGGVASATGVGAAKGMSPVAAATRIGGVAARRGSYLETPGSGAAETGAAVAESLGGTFTVLNYNVHGLPSFITGDDTPARMGLIGPLLGRFPIVALQEDWDDRNHLTLVSGSRHPFEERKSDALPGRAYGTGLALLSSYAMVGLAERFYSACFGDLLGPGAGDCLASKGFQLTRLRLSVTRDAEIDVYNTHLDSGRGPEDHEARERQIGELLAAMASYSEGRAILFVADTNARSEQLARLLGGARLRDACEEVSCPQPSRIERILIRSGAALQVIATAWRIEAAFRDLAGAPLSDHPAISADIAWRVAR